MKIGRNNMEYSTYKIGENRFVKLVLNEEKLTYTLHPDTSEDDRVEFIKKYNEVQARNNLPLLPDDFCKNQ